MEAVWVRVAGWLMLGASVIVYAVGAISWYKANEAKGKREIAREVEREEEARRYAEEAKQKELQDDAQLDAMPDDAPLEEYLSHLFIDKSEAHHARAVNRINGLPNLVARVEERLSNPLPIQREYCANYIRQCGTPDPAFVPALRKSILLLAQDYRLESENPERHMITHVKGLTWGTLLTIQRFSGVDFKKEVGELREAVSLWPQSDERDAAIEYIDMFIRGEKVPE